MQTTNMPSKATFFAVRLKELRAKAELSQNQLAEKSGVPVGTIRYFEYGLREPTFETLLKLGRGLGVSLAAFEPQDAALSDARKANAPKPTKPQPKKPKR